MKRRPLGSTSIVTTVIGYGTSRLHYVSAEERIRLIKAAHERGIRHFDTAPCYGHGAAEMALGKALMYVREEVTIATKYGVEPRRLCVAAEGVSPVFGSVTRAVAAISERVRPRVAEWTYDVEGLDRSIRHSLKRLRTDYIDILFLHEPNVARLGEAERLWEFLGKLREKGVVKEVGLAGRWQAVLAVRGLMPEELRPVTQTGEKEWSPPDEPHITFGVLASGRQSYFRHETSAKNVENAIRKAVGRRNQGSVLVSTTRLAHLDQIVRAVEA